MNISDLELFVQIADSGNISSAAHQLNISPAAASAALKRLEKQLGAQLFIRTTRRMRITVAGERFLPLCREGLGSILSAKDSIADQQGTIAGKMHLSVSSDLGRNILLPWLEELMTKNPDLSFQLTIGDSLADFYMDRVDLALRYGQPEDSTMVAFELASIDRVLCASPAYIELHGSPIEPQDLLSHNTLLYKLGDQVYDHWEFMPSTNQNSTVSKQKVKVTSNRTCNDGDIVRRWAIAAKGIALKSRLDIHKDLNSGKLVELMLDYKVKPTSLWLICPSKQQITPAVILLRDTIRDKCLKLATG